MSKVDEYIKAGAVRRNGPTNGESDGGSLEPTPFIKWPQSDRAYVTGEVTGLWSGAYGENVTIRVTEHSPGLEGDAMGVRASVSVGQEVNVGLNPATLKETVSEADKGKVICVAFDGWKEPAKAGGNRYRLFTVLEIPGAPAVADTPVVNTPAEEADDSLPF